MSGYNQVLLCITFTALIAAGVFGMPRTTTRPSTVEKLVCVKKGENFTFRANNWSCKMPKVCEHELGLMPYEKTLAKSCQECCWVPKTTPPVEPIYESTKKEPITRLPTAQQQENPGTQCKWLAWLVPVVVTCIIITLGIFITCKTRVYQMCFKKPCTDGSVDMQLNVPFGQQPEDQDGVGAPKETVYVGAGV